MQIQDQSDSQAARTVLMIRPVNFGFNEQTSGSNRFQSRSTDEASIQETALREFDELTAKLIENGVNVQIVEDTRQPSTPDSIFPNNWVSFHGDGTVFLYPMMAENRRLERREDILRDLQDKFEIRRIIDLSHFERENRFLEGTGSLVLDRGNRILYACHSPRTEQEVLDEFCKLTGYTAVQFKAVDRDGLPVYHTNVLMCLGARFAVICTDAIPDPAERRRVTQQLEAGGRKIIPISIPQMHRFAGNMLELSGRSGESLLVLSKGAWQSLDSEQQNMLSGFSKPIFTDLSTIEQNGGGSARCMIAEIFLPLAD